MGYENSENQSIDNLTVIREVAFDEWLCVCECGEYVILLGSELTKRTRNPKSCGCLVTEPKTTLVGLQVGGLEVLERVDATRYKCRCVCGRYEVVSKSRLERGSAQQCRSCGRTSSNNEQIVKMHLDSLGVQYWREYTPSDMDKKLRFDFVVKIRNERFAIETHGAQHYQSVAHYGGDTKLKQQMEHDEVNYSNFRYS